MKEQIRNKFSLYFRNNWGIKVNLQYYLYLQYCRIFSNSLNLLQKDKDVSMKAWKEGFSKMDIVNVSDLKSLCMDHFEKIEIKDGCGSLPRSIIEDLADPIYEIIQKLKGPIRAYYRSHFRINWIDIQKIIPGSQPKGSSFSYHVDDSPYSLAKVFVYLTDAFKDNSAFRAFNYNFTDKFIKLGILKTTQPGKMRDSCQSIVKIEDEEHLNIFDMGDPKISLFLECKK